MAANRHIARTATQLQAQGSHSRRRGVRGKPKTQHPHIPTTCTLPPVSLITPETNYRNHRNHHN